LPTWGYQEHQLAWQRAGHQLLTYPNGTLDRIDAAARTWTHAARMLSDASLSLVVLDEITYLFQYGYLPLETLLQALRQRPPRPHVVIAGRPCPAELEALADTMAEVKNIQHAFAAGVKAQPGIDW